MVRIEEKGKKEGGKKKGQKGEMGEIMMEKQYGE